MSKNSYHVVPVQDGGWSVKRAGATRASKTFAVKIDAIVFGKQLSTNHYTELIIHRKDGTIQNANSYGEGQTLNKSKKING